MKGFLIGCGSLTALGIIVLIILGVVVLGYYNRETELRNQFDAQQKANEATYDTVWKTVSQQAQVADAYKDAFKEVWAEIVKGGPSGTAALQVFINRHNPQFDGRLYVKLMNTIEGQRKEFLNAQKKLIDIKREHDSLRQRFPSRIFVGSKPELELRIVTSDRTEETFRSGKDNDTEVFQKKGK